MADVFTGLGMTLEERKKLDGALSLSELAQGARERESGSKITPCTFGRLSIGEDGHGLMLDGDRFAELDELAYELFCKVFSIPVPYMRKLDRETKNANLLFWFRHFDDKEAELVFRDGELVDVREGARIDVVDVLDILDEECIGGMVLGTMQQPNATVMDLYMPSRRYEHSGREYFGGVRVVVKRGLNAPELSPMFVDSDSCGVIECAEWVDRIPIKNLGYRDILHVIEEQAHGCVASLDGLFETYRSIADSAVPNPKRRIRLYCREHALPERVRDYALGAYERSGAQSACLGDIISLFSALGSIDEVKQQSERKLQQLAGHIVVSAKSEGRCGKCDSMLLDG